MRSSLDPGLTENALHKIRNKQWDYQGCALYQLPTQLVNSTISCVTNQMHAQMVKYQPAKIVDWNLTKCKFKVPRGSHCPSPAILIVLESNTMLTGGDLGLSLGILPILQLKSRIAIKDSLDEVTLQRHWKIQEKKKKKIQQRFPTNNKKNKINILSHSKQICKSFQNSPSTLRLHFNFLSATNILT